MEKLRPCIARKDGEEHEGYFHVWAVKSVGRLSVLHGIVEYEDGTVHRIYPECIAFTDRDCGDNFSS